MMHEFDQASDWMRDQIKLKRDLPSPDAPDAHCSSRR